MIRNRVLPAVAGVLTVVVVVAAVLIGIRIGESRERAAIAAWGLPRYVDVCNEPVIASWDIVPTIYNENPIDFVRRIMEPIDYYVGVPLGAPCRGTIGWADAEVFGPCAHLRLKDAPVSWCSNSGLLPGKPDLTTLSDSFYVSHNGAANRFGQRRIRGIPRRTGRLRRLPGVHTHLG